jgi:hypothetical protein
MTLEKRLLKLKIELKNSHAKIEKELREYEGETWSKKFGEMTALEFCIYRIESILEMEK